MTWELAISILKELVVAAIGGGLVAQVYKNKAARQASDEANDQNIRGELWKEVKEIRTVEAKWTQERIAYERKIMGLEQELRDCRKDRGRQ